MAYNNANINKEDSEYTKPSVNRKTKNQTGSESAASAAATIVPIVIFAGVLIYNIFSYFLPTYTDSGALRNAKEIINEGLEKDNVGYRLNDLTLIRKGNYQDAVNTFDTPDFGSDVSTSGTFFLAKGTFSDGEETDVCIYRYQESSKSTIILTGPCK